MVNLTEVILIQQYLICKEAILRYILAIGVGHGIKYSELKMITGHSSSYVFPV